jgi:hypothetical protein
LKNGRLQQLGNTQQNAQALPQRSFFRAIGWFGAQWLRAKAA